MASETRDSLKLSRNPGCPLARAWAVRLSVWRRFPSRVRGRSDYSMRPARPRARLRERHPELQDRLSDLDIWAVLSYIEAHGPDIHARQHWVDHSKPYIDHRRKVVVGLENEPSLLRLHPNADQRRQIPRRALDRTGD